MEKRNFARHLSTGVAESAIDSLPRFQNALDEICPRDSAPFQAIEPTMPPNVIVCPL
jgi:hypothetical protein